MDLLYIELSLDLLSYLLSFNLIAKLYSTYFRDYRTRYLSVYNEGKNPQLPASSFPKNKLIN